MSLLSGNTLQCSISAKFDDKNIKMRQLFRQIEKVSPTIDTWTTKNHLVIIGITIHWIDDLWNLREFFIVVEELCGSHGGAHMTKVLHDLLVDYNLMDKIRCFFNFCIIFVLNTYFPCFVSLCAITVDNANNNKTMA